MAKTKVKAKKKTPNGKVDKQDRALVVSRGCAALMEHAAKHLGLAKWKPDKNYFIPIVQRRHTLWLKFVDKKSGQVSWQPYIRHPGLIDALEQRGWKEFTTERLESMQCIKCNCYNARESDWTQRFRCRVVLKDGKVATFEGDACRHNTSAMIHGSERFRANAIARMAETRAVGRAIRHCCNIGSVSIMELPALDKTQEWRVGDQVMSTAEVERIIEGDFRVVDEQGATAPSKAYDRGAAPAETKTKAAPPPKEEAPSPEWTAANRTLHAAIKDIGLTEYTEQVHEHMRATSSRQTGREIGSIRQLQPQELSKWATYFLRLSTEQLTVFKGWCRETKEGGGS